MDAFILLGVSKKEKLTLNRLEFVSKKEKLTLNRLEFGFIKYPLHATCFEKH